MHRSHPVDRLVGQRVRLARLAKGMSQSGLGDAVGITFQQIQKYEKGANRVSASKLSEFAAILGMDIAYFFENADEHTNARPKPDSDPSIANLSRVDFAILQSLSEIKNRKLKRKLLDLITSIASHGKSSATAET
jgi:transcriptional regulator with XRE-family HTH domain